jgi:hypothetical protein
VEGTHTKKRGAYPEKTRTNPTYPTYPTFPKKRGMRKLKYFIYINASSRNNIFQRTRETAQESSRTSRIIFDIA